MPLTMEKGFLRFGARNIERDTNVSSRFMSPLPRDSWFFLLQELIESFAHPRIR